jgi:hypothetical protein
LLGDEATGHDPDRDLGVDEQASGGLLDELADPGVRHQENVHSMVPFEAQAFVDERVEDGKPAVAGCRAGLEAQMDDWQPDRCGREPASNRDPTAPGASRHARL